MRPVTLFHGWSLAGSYAAMLVVGLLLSIYGPIVAVLQERFGLSGAAGGAALGTQSFGAVLGVLLAQPILRSRGNRATLASSLLCVAVGAVVIAVSPVWPLVLSGAAIAGLGFGGVDSLVTQMLLIGSGNKGPARVNIAHACFGLGTVAGAVLVYLACAENYPWVFIGAAAVSILALASTSGSRGGQRSQRRPRSAARHPVRECEAGRQWSR